MFPTPDTVYVLKDFDRRTLLAEAERARLARQARGPNPRPFRLTTVLRAVRIFRVRLGWRPVTVSAAAIERPVTNQL